MAWCARLGLARFVLAWCARLGSARFAPRSAPFDLYCGVPLACLVFGVVVCTLSLLFFGFWMCSLRHAPRDGSTPLNNPFTPFGLFHGLLYFLFLLVSGDFVLVSFELFGRIGSGHFPHAMQLVASPQKVGQHHGLVV